MATLVEANGLITAPEAIGELQREWRVESEERIVKRESRWGGMGSVGDDAINFPKLSGRKAAKAYPPPPEPFLGYMGHCM